MGHHMSPRHQDFVSTTRIYSSARPWPQDAEQEPQKPHVAHPQKCLKALESHSMSQMKRIRNEGREQRSQRTKADAACGNFSGTCRPPEPKSRTLQRRHSSSAHHSEFTLFVNSRQEAHSLLGVRELTLFAFQPQTHSHLC